MDKPFKNSIARQWNAAALNSKVFKKNKKAREQVFERLAKGNYMLKKNKSKQRHVSMSLDLVNTI